MWPFKKNPSDSRSKRLVFLIECLLNQNARDLGAAMYPAATRPVIDLLLDAGIGIAQIPCPEMACLGFRRDRPAGQPLRSAMETAESRACCRSLAQGIADRIEDYRAQGCEIVAVLGGNPRSPGCAVHGDDPGSVAADPASGVFMAALGAELAVRGIAIPFFPVRDADAPSLETDLNRLRNVLFKK